MPPTAVVPPLLALPAELVTPPDGAAPEPAAATAISDLSLPLQAKASTRLNKVASAGDDEPSHFESMTADYHLPREHQARFRGGSVATGRGTDIA
jgi:hypothetical protein